MIRSTKPKKTYGMSAIRAIARQATRLRRGTLRRRVFRRNRTGAERGVYHFKRWANNTSGNFTISGNVAYAPYQAANVYQLDHLPNVSDFANLFDHYRINKIVMRFWLRIDPSASSAATASYPKLYSVIDNDDNTLLSQSQMREHPNCKIQVLQPNRPVVRAFCPSTLSLSYLSAVASTYTPKWKQWVDMANTGVPHYCLKWNIDDFTNTNYKLDVETCYYFSVKGVR